MITPGFCNQAKLEMVRALVNGDLRVALYTKDAQLDPQTSAYTPLGEVKGDGYAAGGKPVVSSVGLSGDTAWLDLDDLVWEGATFTARGAMVYAAARQNAAIVVLDFGRDFSASDGRFVLIWPAPGTQAIIRVP